MDYHYPDLCLPNDPMMSAPYTQEFTPQYLIPTREAEYEARSSILVDGGDRFGVSAVVFDKYEELIWMGNQGGHVTSYYGPGMQKYTSFQVHSTEEIRDIITHEEALFILTKSILRKQIRRGLPKHTYKSPNMTDMQCLFQESPTKLLMGGHQDKLLELDITKMIETVIPIEEEGCAVLRSGGGSLVACGSASGDVTLRDVRTNSPEHTFKAHTACLSDLDMQGDLLITCGFAQSVQMGLSRYCSASGMFAKSRVDCFNSTVRKRCTSLARRVRASPNTILDLFAIRVSGAVAEPYVIVWDVRYLRNKATNGTSGAWSVPIASPPLLLHFLPAFSGRAVASAGDGLVALLHVNNAQEEQSVFQVDTQNSQCTVMDVSASSQALVFGDQSGHLNLFSPQHNHEPVFNSFSRATEFAHQVELPHVSFSDTTFQFSSIPLPPLTTGGRWFNELPDSFYWNGYRKPKPIDPEVLKTMKMQGPIGYAPNPRTTRRNQMPYVEDKLEDLQAKCQEQRHVAPPIPKYYLRKDIRYIKHGTNEEIEALNKTGLPGIEATLPNSYCNVMLQVLYYMPPVKATLLAHTCAKEFCLSCELGFLFRMLDSSGGSPCNATNFLRAFRTVPEAAALGLILPDRAADPRVDLIALIQSWNRFILHQMHYEILETRKKEKELHILANSPPKSSLSSRVSNHKIKSSVTTPHMNGTCGDEYTYTEIEFLGPTEVDGHELKEDGWISRDEVINENEHNHVNHENHELNHRQSEREESEISQLFAIGRHQMNRCLKCNKEEGRESVVLACALQYPSAPRETESRGTFIDLIRASLSSRRSTPAWCEHCGKFTPTTQRGKLVRLPPILAINCGGVTVREKAYWAKGTQKDMSECKRGASNKPCRYGLHCARPGCHFKHPERANSSPGGASKSPSQESNCVLPLQLVIRLQSDGDVLVNDKLDQSPTDPPTPNHRPDKHKKRHVTTQSEEEYTLSAAVVCVEDTPKHLVAYVRTGSEEPCWHLFNDLCIVPVSVEEVSQFTAWWKTPCVVMYSYVRPRRPATALHS